MNCDRFNFQKNNSRRSFASPRRDAPEPLMNLSPHGGRGECRVPVAPAVSCALCSGRMHTSNNEYTGTPGIPARNGFTAYVVLSSMTGLFCHRRLADIVLSKPGWADRTPQNLTPASGRQDHTILPSAATSLVSTLGDRSRAKARPAIPRAQNAAASTASHAYVRDDRDTPLLGRGMARICRDDLPDG